MRLVLGQESVADAVDRTLDALLRWADASTLLQLKSDWQEQQVHVWGSREQGSAVSLMHSVLLRANRDELRPHLLRQPVPSLHVKWVLVSDIEAGEWKIDPDAQPGVASALQSLRVHIQQQPEVLLRYLADMGQMSSQHKSKTPLDEHLELRSASGHRNTLPLNLIKPPECGDGTFTIDEISLLYQAFLLPGEMVDITPMLQRFLATGKLVAVDGTRAVRGTTEAYPALSQLYRYTG
jgi:hypothetical protein